MELDADKVGPGSEGGLLPPAFAQCPVFLKKKCFHCGRNNASNADYCMWCFTSFLITDVDVDRAIFVRGSSDWDRALSHDESTPPKDLGMQVDLPA
jgi:hypothetical protein